MSTVEMTEKNENVARRPRSKSPPWGASWRSSTWYITIVVTYGAMTEALCYMVGVPVIPFRLEDLGYDHISTKASWFLFSYCIAIAVSTLPTAIFLDRKAWRRGPLMAATCAMQVALLLLIFVDKYAVMILARTIQGLSCSIIWSIGFALICENVEKKNIGRQLGFAFSGMSIGNIVGPAAGGGLYTTLGWKAPWIFCMIVCSVELLGRWLAVEQKDLIKYQHGSPTSSEEATNTIASSSNNRQSLDHTPYSDQAANDQTNRDERKKESALQVVKFLFTLPRSLTGIAVNFRLGLILGAIDPTLTLRLRDQWGKDSHFAGLVYLATAVPCLITSPVEGWLADKIGAEWILSPAAILSAPFPLLMMLSKSLPGFIICFVLFFVLLNSTLAPVGVEVAAVAAQNRGISELHQFAALNLAWSISGAVGTIIGGQLYDHVGWNAICWFSFATSLVLLPVTMVYTGERPLFYRMVYKKSQQSPPSEEQ
ncbi:hypothetical protein I204_01896 [Kwoniella mangroviensis CBS 8886]|uniref:uncharacterized protein n=1 Tax=Kwoniella mangroviensis CBS 8507 TaxID=1296122 RepID=UPI00080CCAC6|nr:hypothetical protein I204_01896 [Kwoniella mangroviensis CBS 8886]